MARFRLGRIRGAIVHVALTEALGHENLHRLQVVDPLHRRVHGAQSAPPAHQQRRIDIEEDEERGAHRQWLRLWRLDRGDDAGEIGVRGSAVDQRWAVEEESR